jgi:multiple RNA-binding domain-containing protein 1
MFADDVEHLGKSIVEIYLILLILKSTYRATNFMLTFLPGHKVHIPLDPATKSPKGLAFVTFKDGDAAVQAYEALDKTSFQGRLLHILPAVERKGAAVEGGNADDGASKKATLKGDKEKERKKNATREFNWSMLYMNVCVLFIMNKWFNMLMSFFVQADAVASSIASRMNIPKSEILNPESTDGASAAVKLALAETHIISETKTYLESEGINLACFSDLAPTSGTGSGANGARLRRSDTVILVKNIPYGTTAQQIRELFESHGELSRVLVPPAGTIAVVEYVHPDDASKGFRAVAYRRLGSSIIYLEKAPLGIFSGVKKASADDHSTAGPSKFGAPVTIPEDAKDANAEDTAVPGSTLFVKNLSFATTSERLTQVFRHLPDFSFARVQTKPDPKHVPRPGDTTPAPRLSMGFGFVGFKTAEAAKTALSSMHGFVLDGHTLSVKFAGRGTEEDKKEKGAAKATSTKMVVKNVPFEASKKDIRDLFGCVHLIIL